MTDFLEEWETTLQGLGHEPSSNEAIRLLPTFCTLEARRVIIEMDEYEEKDWNKLKERMETYFAPKDPRRDYNTVSWLLNLANKYSTEGGILRDYFREFYSSFNQIKKRDFVSEEHAINIVMSSLPDAVVHEITRRQ